MCSKMKLRSGRFGEIDVEVYEAKNDFGNPIHLIGHTELLNIIDNKMPEDIKIEYDWEDIQVLEPHHYIVKAWIKDSNGICVRAFGESLPATLKSDIAKQYPATMATNRAIDRAIIKYLDLPRTYSTEEISFNDVEMVPAKNNVSKETSSEPKENIPVMASIDSAGEFEEKETKKDELKEEVTSNEEKHVSLAEKKQSKLKPNPRRTTTETDKQEVKETNTEEVNENKEATEENVSETKNETIANGSEKVEEKPEPKEDAPTATSIPEVKPHKTVGNSTFITFGRCKGKSLDETFEEDLATLKWIAENIYDGPHEKLGNTVRRYLDFKKVNYAQKQAG